MTEALTLFFMMLPVVLIGTFLGLWMGLFLLRHYRHRLRRWLLGPRRPSHSLKPLSPDEIEAFRGRAKRKSGGR